MRREGHPANEPHLSRSGKERKNLPLSDRASNEASSLYISQYDVKTPIGLSRDREYERFYGRFRDASIEKGNKKVRPCSKC